jgi:hypothetical protein
MLLIKKLGFGFQIIESKVIPILYMTRKIVKTLQKFLIFFENKLGIRNYPLPFHDLLKTKSLKIFIQCRMV